MFHRCINIQRYKGMQCLMQCARLNAAFLQDASLRDFMHPPPLVASRLHPTGVVGAPSLRAAVRAFFGALNDGSRMADAIIRANRPWCWRQRSACRLARSIFCPRRFATSPHWRCRPGPKFSGARFSRLRYCAWRYLVGPAFWGAIYASPAPRCHEHRWRLLLVLQVACSLSICALAYLYCLMPYAAET